MEISKEELEAFAQRVLDVRHRLRLNQKTMADKMGLSDSFLSQVEAAKSKPGYVFFKGMYEKFNVNPIFLLTGQGEMVLGDKEELKLPEKKVYGEFQEVFEDMLYYISNCPMVKMAVLEHYIWYKGNNKALIEEETEKFLASQKKIKA